MLKRPNFAWENGLKGDKLVREREYFLYALYFQSIEAFNNATRAFWLQYFIRKQMFDYSDLFRNLEKFASSHLGNQLTL